MSIVLIGRPPTVTFRRLDALPCWAPNCLFKRLQPVKKTPAVAAAFLRNSLRLVMKNSPCSLSVLCRPGTRDGLHRSSAVNFEQAPDQLRRSASGNTALRGDAKICGILAGHRDAFVGSFNAIRVYQAQVEFGAGRESQP